MKKGEKEKLDKRKKGKKGERGQMEQGTERKAEGNFDENGEIFPFLA